MPYPSNIVVTGAAGSLVAVTATLDGFTHEFPADLDILLSGPTPTTNVLLLSDTGGNQPVSGIDVTFDDAAPSGVPSLIVGGTFRPTNVTGDDDDSFAAPAPATSSATALSTFAGSDPNGTWSLWVEDGATGDGGSISGGWCLTLTTQQATATTVVSDVNPSVSGQAVTFTATVTAGGNPVTAGSVQFADGSTVLAPAVPVATDGTATFATSALAEGTHPIAAAYSGAAPFTESSASVSQLVKTAVTIASVSSDLNPSTAGDAVTFTATVTTGGTPVPSGTVQFEVDDVLAAPATPVAPDGTVTFTTSTLSTGLHSIRAIYFGGDLYNTSVVGLIQEVLAPIAPDAGGPYTIAEGDDLALDGGGSLPVAGSTYAWDVNGDGDFSDATGIAPMISWAQLEAYGIDDGPLSGSITLRVTVDSRSATDSVALEVVNTAPITIVTGDATATAGTPFTLKVGAADPSSADMAAMFTYTVDWGDGSPAETIVGPADPPVTHTYAAAGSVTAMFSAADKDGAVGVGVIVLVDVQPQAAPGPDPAPDPSPPPGPLPPTGVEVQGTLAIGVGLLMFGLVLMVARRRARRS